VQLHGSPRSPAADAEVFISSNRAHDGAPTGSLPSNAAAAGASASLPRRPSLGSVLRAVSLPCQPCGDDDPTVSPLSEPAGAVKTAQACRRFISGFVNTLILTQGWTPLSCMH